MPLLVLITGKQGAGKSFLAQQWAKDHQARHIDVDPVLVAGGRKLPGSTHKETDWDLWRTTCKRTRVDVLILGLNETYSDLNGYNGNLVIEGAILCNDWFLKDFQEALKVLNLGATDERYFYLNASNETILRNVHSRADKDPEHRGPERGLFPTVDEVASKHLGFDEAVGEIPGRWVEIRGYDDLLSELQRRHT